MRGTIPSHKTDAGFAAISLNRNVDLIPIMVCLREKNSLGMVLEQSPRIMFA